MLSKFRDNLLLRNFLPIFFQKLSIFGFGVYTEKKIKSCIFAHQFFWSTFYISVLPTFVFAKISPIFCHFLCQLPHFPILVSVFFFGAFTYGQKTNLLRFHYHVSRKTEDIRRDTMKHDMF